MSSSSEWASVMMGGAQFAAGICVAYYTLNKQHTASLAQRDGAWFHLVVADKTIAELHALVEVEGAALHTSAIKCIAIKNNQQTQILIDECFRNELFAFRERLKPIRKKLENFAFLFDKRLYLAVSEQFQKLEDVVSEWFDRLQRDGPVDRRDALMEVVCECQRNLLKVFRDFEFVTIPAMQREAARNRAPLTTALLWGGGIADILAIFAHFTHLALEFGTAASITTIHVDSGPAASLFAAGTLVILVALYQLLLNKKERRRVD